MTHAPHTSRRAVLRAMLAAALGGAGPLGLGAFTGCSSADEERGANGVSSRALAFLPGPATVRPLGERVLRGLPADTDATTIEAQLFSHERWHSAGAVDALIAEQIAADFETGRIANIEGWILAETEALLCALAVLLERSGQELER